MHQHTGLRQVGRTILTITGIVLLIIFGARAASQASNLAAVGGKTKQGIATIPTNMNWLTELDTHNVTAGQQQRLVTSASVTGAPITTEEPTQNEIAKLNEAAHNLAAKAEQTADVSLVKPSDKNDTDKFSQVDTSGLDKYKHNKDSVK